MIRVVEIPALFAPGLVRHHAVPFRPGHARVELSLIAHRRQLIAEIDRGGQRLASCPDSREGDRVGQHLIARREARTKTPLAAHRRPPTIARPSTAAPTTSGETDTDR